MRRVRCRNAIRAVLIGAAAPLMLCALTGCMPADDGASGGNANANDNRVDPALLDLLEVEEIDHVEGDPEAPNTIIQYANFECLECGEFFRTNRPAVISELVDTGRARLVFRHLPVSSIHPAARLAAIASECAVDFIEYHDLLFQHQDALTREDLIGYAEEVGLNPETFGNCLQSGSKTPRVERDIESAAELEITDTPTFFVNDHILIGDHPVEDFEALLD